MFIDSKTKEKRITIKNHKFKKLKLENGQAI